MISSRALLINLMTLAALTFGNAWANSVRIYNLSAEDWARPRTGSVIPALEPVRLAVVYWESNGDAAILLNYPGDDSGELWASELKDWLVTLGVPSDYILMSPGLQADTELRIMVGNRRELTQ
jgi:hypothetical protein